MRFYDLDLSVINARAVKSPTLIERGDFLVASSAENVHGYAVERGSAVAVVNADERLVVKGAEGEEIEVPGGIDSLPLTVCAIDGGSVYVDPWGSPVSRPADEVVEVHALKAFILSVARRYAGTAAETSVAAEVDGLIDWIDDHTLVV